MAKKFAGKKISGSHSTAIDAACELIASLEKMPNILKISLGIIRQCSPGRGTQNIKVKDTLSGLEVMVRGNSYVQSIYVYLDEKSEEAREKLKQDMLNIYFSKKNRRNRL